MRAVIVPVAPTAATAAELPAVTYGESFTGTALSGSGAVITPNSAHTAIAVVELDGAGKAVGCGRGKLNIG